MKINITNFCVFLLIIMEYHSILWKYILKIHYKNYDIYIKIIYSK